MRRRTPINEFDERYFPVAFVSRCLPEGENVCIRIFDPTLEVWRFITLDQWRGVLDAARALSGPPNS